MPATINKIVTADSRGRVALGAVAAGQTFAVHESDDGEVSLTPMVTIPKREAWLWNNSEARSSFDKGVKESEAGRGVPMDFSAYLEHDAD